ncbi:hypothetical protein [Salinibacter ruber]|uniref:hypothetical protein n=1 Tax=Salinibacter ruber TaxID=146919 RepID=UPI00216A23F3|nr:hypothetical protein [Salinibacter ruber]MCS3685798.1 hypothetical protein [Salinibacter ruber]
MLFRKGEVFFLGFYSLWKLLLAKLVPDDRKHAGTVAQLIEDGSDGFRKRHASGPISFQVKIRVEVRVRLVIGHGKFLLVVLNGAGASGSSAPAQKCPCAKASLHPLPKPTEFCEFPR